MSYQPPRACSDEKARILRSAHRHVIPGRVTVFSQLGIDLVMGPREGYRFWDVDGQEYLDFHLNGGVYTLGHRCPELLGVLRKSMETLDIGNHHFPSRARSALAELLTRVTPGNLQYTVFTSGGSEAIDVAIKSARYATRRRRIVALEDAYHGRTGLSGAAGDAATAALFHSDNPVEFIRVPFEDLGALETALSREDVAAVLMETIPATSGFVTPTASYLPGVKSLCERYGTLYIADEVQTGLGRTGHLWGVDAWNVKPDILVTAKGLSGGLYPIGATVLSARAGAWLVEHGWGHPSSYGGAEVGCAVAHRVLEICSDPENLAHARRISDYLAAGFQDIQQRHPYLRKVHRQCLVMGLEFDSPSGGVDMMKALYDRGLWAIVAGFNSAMLQVKPGFLIDTQYCDEALEHFEAAITVAERLPKGKGTRFVSDGKSGGAVRAA
jgi:acetylornithine/succinyldiaminopimelate/putrescine aminotransferase